MSLVACFRRWNFDNVLLPREDAIGFHENSGLIVGVVLGSDHASVEGDLLFEVRDAPIFLGAYFALEHLFAAEGFAHRRCSKGTFLGISLSDHAFDHGLLFERFFFLLRGSINCASNGIQLLKTFVCHRVKNPPGRHLLVGARNRAGKGRA